LSQTKFGFLKD